MGSQLCFSSNTWEVQFRLVCVTSSFCQVRLDQEYVDGLYVIRVLSLAACSCRMRHPIRHQDNLDRKEVRVRFEGGLKSF